MNLLFPQNPLMRKLPEPIFEAEFDAAQALGFNWPWLWDGSGKAFDFFYPIRDEYR